MRPHPPTSTLFPYTPPLADRPKAAQKPAPRPRAASERRTPRPSRIRHRPQRRRRPLGQKRLGRTQLTRPGHTHILAYNPPLGLVTPPANWSNKQRSPGRWPGLPNVKDDSTHLGAMLRLITEWS